MKKIILPVLAAVAIIAVGVSFSYHQKLGNSRAEYATLQAEEQATNARYAAAIDEVASIQESLQDIDLGEQGTQALQSELAQEQRLSENRGEQTMARIAEIKAGVEKADARIRELEEKVKQGDVQVAGMEKLIRGLRRNVAEKEEQIAQLTIRVAELQTQVVDLETTVAAKDQTIQMQTANLEDSRREKDTVYYVVGTKDELKDAGLIESKGGLLGIGRTLRPTGNIEGGAFTPLDTESNATIALDVDEARVISTQPAGSYELSEYDGGMELRILDPAAFRANKYVIIVSN